MMHLWLVVLGLSGGISSVGRAGDITSPPPGAIRVATCNASLNREHAGRLVENLFPTSDAQARNVAEIIQRTQPDLLLLNEFDYDEAGRSVTLFQDNYLAKTPNGTQLILSAYRAATEVNTGVASGQDLDYEGQVSRQAGSRT